MDEKPKTKQQRSAPAEAEPVEPAESLRNEESETANAAEIIEFPTPEPIPAPSRTAEEVKNEIAQIETRLKTLPGKHVALQTEALSLSGLDEIKKKLAEATSAKVEYDALRFQLVNLRRELISAERYEFSLQYPALREKLERANEDYNKAFADAKSAEKRRDEAEIVMKSAREGVWDIQRRELGFAKRLQDLEREAKRMVGQVVPVEQFDDDRADLVG
jgi:hypothetical protein